MNTNYLRLTVAMGVLLPGQAFAHTVSSGGSVDGLIHPFTGIDHVAAMFTVGAIAAKMTPREGWSLARAFLIAMLFGAVAGVNGVSLPYTETVIASSLVLGGIALTLSWATRRAAIIAAAAFFAMFHGYAHGLEMPVSSPPIAYFLGFLASTALLIGVGHFVTTRVLQASNRGPASLKGLGVAISLGGLAMLAH